MCSTTVLWNRVIQNIFQRDQSRPPNPTKALLNASIACKLSDGSAKKLPANLGILAAKHFPFRSSEVKSAFLL
eukprot:2575423-Amphidinium_carterae.1